MGSLNAAKHIYASNTIYAVIMHHVQTMAYLPLRQKSSDPHRNWNIVIMTTFQTLAIMEFVILTTSSWAMNLVMAFRQHCISVHQLIREHNAQQSRVVFITELVIPLRKIVIQFTHMFSIQQYNDDYNRKVWSLMSFIPSWHYNYTIVYSTVYSVKMKGNIKAPRHWPLWGEFTGDRWIPRTKG